MKLAVRRVLRGAGIAAVFLVLQLLGGVACVPLAAVALFSILVSLPFVWRPLRLSLRAALQFPFGAFALVVIPCAPGIALCWWLHHIWEPFPYAFPLDRLVPGAVAWCSVAAGAYTAFNTIFEKLLRESFWRLRQVRQVGGLATSKAASVALGPAELHGVVRPRAGGSPVVLSFQASPRKEHIEPFYLEDDSGRILVDARGATFRGAFWNLFAARTWEIVLTRPAERSPGDGPWRTALHAGDPVYVIGHVRRLPSASLEGLDSETLVVGPLQERDEANPLLRLRWGRWLDQLQGYSRREAQHVFFLSDTTETRAKRLILRGLYASWLRGALWLGAALTLLAGELPRARQDPFTVREASRPASTAELFTRARDRRRPDRPETVRALFAIAEQDRALVGRMLEFVEDPDPAVASPTRSWLWGMRGPWLHDHVPRLLELLRTADPMLRYYAVAALEHAKPEAAAAAPALAEALGDANADVRRLAATRLKELGPAAAQAAAPLIGLLEDPDAGVRIAALGALSAARLSPDVALPLFRRLLESPDQKMRWGAARALGPMGVDAAPALPALIAAARDDADPYVREAAVISLGKLAAHFTEAIPPVVDAVADDTSRIRLFAVQAVREIGPGAVGAVPALVAHLSRKHDPIVREAAFALGAIGPDAAAALPALLESRRKAPEDARVRRAIELAVCKIEGRCPL